MAGLEVVCDLLARVWGLQFLVGAGSHRGKQSHVLTFMPCCLPNGVLLPTLLPTVRGEVLKIVSHLD